jgi:hypothetical protein
MDIKYSNETLRLGRLSFNERYKRYPDDTELSEYIDSFLKLGLAMIND